MTDIIDQIDAATGCQQCGKPLGVSPSADYCSEWCQRTWTARAHRTAQLPVGVRAEPATPGRAQEVHVDWGHSYGVVTDEGYLMADSDLPQPDDQNSL